jgi:hypothetical protein
MILRCLIKNCLRACLRRDWRAATLYYRLWRDCIKPTPF